MASSKLAGWTLISVGGVVLIAGATGVTPWQWFTETLHGNPQAAAKPLKVDSVRLDLPGGAGATNKPTANITTSDPIVAVALQHLGDRYVWGAEGPNQFDCSGLTQFSYWQGIGMRIPRTAHEQAWASKRVAKPNPGDLFFLGTPAYHVGIVISSTQMVNAPDRNQVVKVDVIPRNAYFGSFLR